MPSLSYKDDNLETPEWIIEEIEKSTGEKISLDLCANTHNKKAEKCLTIWDDFLTKDLDSFNFGFCNPPRSKNGKFVKRCIEVAPITDVGICMLLCWNDLGNKYMDGLREKILSGQLLWNNLGKVKFNKNGKETKFVSRLSYFWVVIK